MKVLYLYAGTRRKLYEEFLKGEQPDTALVGLNHLSKFGIEAEFYETKFTEILRKISFNLTQLPVMFGIGNYDVVFSGSGLLTLFLVKFVLGRKKPKWFIYNTYLSNLIKRNRTGLKGWFIRKSISSADGIICPSEAQRTFLEEEGFDKSKLHFLPYGIDENFYSNIKSSSNEKYIISAGRDVGRDYKVLIDALSGTEIPLTIGALPRNFPGIENFPSNIEVDYFKPKVLAGLMKSAQFVVIPTIPEDKMIGSDCSGQYVLLESMMLGKAIITTSRSTLSDYFKDGENGILVPPESPMALKEAILKLWQNPELAEKMGRTNAGLARKLFTTKRFAEDFAKLLKNK